jgi:hypothetical protein
VRARDVIEDCLNLFCWIFTVGVLLSYLFADEIRIGQVALLGGAFVLGRILRLFFTDRPIWVRKEASRG